MSTSDHLNEVSRLEEQRDEHLRTAEQGLSGGVLPARSLAHAQIATVLQMQIDRKVTDWNEMMRGC